MSNWFFKLLTIGANKVNEAGEKAVENYIDIQREGRAVVANKRKAIEQRNTKVVKSQTFIKLKQQEIEGKKASLDKMNLIAEKALAAGEESDARQALVQAERLEDDIVVLQGIVDELQPIVDDSIQQIEEYKIEISRIESEIERLDHIYESIKYREELEGGNFGSGGAFDMDSLRSLVNKAKATSEAKAEIKEKTGGNLEKKYSNIKSESNVDSRLEELKKKLAADKSAKKKS
ncbi:PspA/IM30 family protein [Acinetobacter baumannii]|uniref:PspA/IM30 family protein n=1 Tax=Acinetobacter baumannii TaxID=470 RepID=UPI00367351AD